MHLTNNTEDPDFKLIAGINKSWIASICSVTNTFWQVNAYDHEICSFALQVCGTVIMGKRPRWLVSYLRW